MPNWSENRLTVYGIRNPEQLNEFINTGVKDGVWKMSSYKPIPEELVATISPSSDREYVNESEVISAKNRLSKQDENIKKFEDKLSSCEPEMIVYYTRELEKAKEPIIIPDLIKSNNSTPEDREHLIEKYGYDNWYDWSNRNWGTKWDSTSDYLEIGDNMVTIDFNTAWCVPAKLLETIQKQFPDLLIKCTFIDETGDPSGILYSCDENAGELIYEYSDECLMKDDSGKLYYYDDEEEVYKDMDDNVYTDDEFWDLGAYNFNVMEDVDLWFDELIK